MQRQSWIQPLVRYSSVVCFWGEREEGRKRGGEILIYEELSAHDMPKIKDKSQGSFNTRKKQNTIVNSDAI